MKYTTESIAKLTSAAQAATRKAEAARAEAADLEARAERRRTLDESTSDLDKESRKYRDLAARYEKEAVDLEGQARKAAATLTRDQAAEALEITRQAVRQAAAASSEAAKKITEFRSKWAAAWKTFPDVNEAFASLRGTTGGTYGLLESEINRLATDAHGYIPIESWAANMEQIAAELETKMISPIANRLALAEAELRAL
jgi:hypothetical protein